MSKAGMTHARLDEMTKGWFVGPFQPTAFHTDLCEVAVKAYPAGSTEEEHYHKVSTEITTIVSGRVEMCGQEWGPGAVIVLPPNTATAFKALEDTVTTVVKVPAAANDKYLGRPEA